MTNDKKGLSSAQREYLLSALKTRFETHMPRHDGIAWNNVKARLETDEEKLWSLSQMESSGGEPDVVGYDNVTGEYTFIDCSPESPIGRRSICYDRAALESRKANKPVNSALDMACDMGIELLTEEQYRQLQTLGRFDAKTSSWLKTPDEIRKLGGAIFADYRYGTVFVYHNSADSYYRSGASAALCGYRQDTFLRIALSSSDERREGCASCSPGVS